MKVISFVLYIISLSVMTTGAKEQKFNDFSGGLKFSSIDPSYSLVTFSGSQVAKGEVVFEIVTIDDYENDIYKVVFIPERPSLFPFVKAGSYAKKLIKIDLLNHTKVKDLLFSAEEWKLAISDSKEHMYISKHVEIEIINYATSVECDSRQYYAEILKVQTQNKLVKISEKRTELMGC